MYGLREGDSYIYLGEGPLFVLDSSLEPLGSVDGYNPAAAPEDTFLYTFREPRWKWSQNGLTVCNISGFCDLFSENDMNFA